MVAHIATYAFSGLDTTPIDVQVHITGGLPAFTIVGLPDKAVGESKERVRAALHSIGLSLPPKRITINLSPANILKEGSHFDLPIALGLMAVLGVLDNDVLAEYVALGELSLDGNLQAVPGILPAAVAAASEDKGIICPQSCGSEARWAGELSILATPSLMRLISHMKGEQMLAIPALNRAPQPAIRRDLKEVKGQAVARRALEIAASGGHNLLMAGPPGSGKSLLAACLPGILPPLTSTEMLETSMIASIAGMLTEGRLQTARPYRDPHHSASMAAMIGGGRKATPGEISLSHNGVLFLDELPEFPRTVLEALRQPLETRTVSVSRVQAHVTYPADFQLIAAMNPCRCGYIGEAGKECGRAPKCAQDYQSKLSGPLLDRIDMHVDVPSVGTLEMFDMPPGEDSATVAARVATTRQRQQARFEGKTDKTLRSNADLDGDMLAQHAQPDTEGMALLRRAAQQMQLSMRAFNRILRVARTIADMEGEAHIRNPHIAEALSYRQPGYYTGAAQPQKSFTSEPV